MSTQLVAIFGFLCFALLILFIGWGALVVSSREEQDQQRWIETMAAVGQQEWPTAKSTYPASDDANRNEADNE